MPICRSRSGNRCALRARTAIYEYLHLPPQPNIDLLYRSYGWVRRLMADFGMQRAFARFGAKLHNVQWSVSARNTEGELVVSLWSHHYDRRVQPEQPSTSIGSIACTLHGHARDGERSTQPRDRSCPRYALSRFSKSLRLPGDPVQSGREHEWRRACAVPKPGVHGKSVSFPKRSGTTASAMGSQTSCTRLS